MPNFYFGTDAALLVDRFQMALSGSLINDAAFVCSIGRVARSGPITALTAATPNVITSAAHGLANGDEIIVTQVLGVTNCNGVRTVAGVTTNSFQLADTIGTGTFLAEGEPYWYLAVPGATDLDVEYVAGSRGRYMVLLPGTLPIASKQRYVAVIDAVGINFHREFTFNGTVWR